MATASIQTKTDTQATRDGSVTSHVVHPPLRNKILGLLPTSEVETVLSRCEMVTVHSKEVVWAREERVNFVYFPEDCVISLVTEMEDGDSVEAMTVGSDGFAGMAVFHGAPSSRLKAIGQITGAARRLSAEDFIELTRECQAFDNLLLCMVIALANRRHLAREPLNFLGSQLQIQVVQICRQFVFAVLPKLPQQLRLLLVVRQAPYSAH